jgi:hypothetical protein
MITINTIEFIVPQKGKLTIYHRYSNSVLPIWQGYVEAGEVSLELDTPLIVTGTVSATLLPDSIEVKIFTKPEEDKD